MPEIKNRYKIEARNQMKKDPKFNTEAHKNSLFSKKICGRDVHIEVKNNLNIMIGKHVLSQRFKSNPEMLKKISAELEKYYSNKIYFIRISELEKSKKITKVLRDVNKLEDNKVLDYLTKLNKKN